MPANAATPALLATPVRLTPIWGGANATALAASDKTALAGAGNLRFTQLLARGAAHETEAANPADGNAAGTPGVALAAKHLGAAAQLLSGALTQALTKVPTGPAAAVTKIAPPVIALPAAAPDSAEPAVASNSANAALAQNLEAQALLLQNALAQAVVAKLGHRPGQSKMAR